MAEYVALRGVKEAIASHSKLKGPQLQRAADAALVIALRRYVQPPMRAAVHDAPRDIKRHSGSGNYVTKRGTLKRSITVRSLRKRPGEMAAYMVGPRQRSGPIATRAFYAGWVIRGTKAHVIRAGGLARGSSLIRIANRNPSSAIALAFNGSVVEVVHHPGVRHTNPEIIRAGERQVAAVKQFVQRDLVAHLNK